MKIAIIGHKRIPSNEGGIEKGVEMHAVRMAALGHSVTVYNRGGHNVFGKEYDGERRKAYKGVRIVTIPTMSGALCVPIYSFLATLHCIISRYDVVSYRASGSCVMIPLAKLFGLRCVASLHGIDSQRDKWGKFARRYLRFGEKMAATKADACLVLSQNTRDYIRNKYGTKAIIFANGITKPQLLEACEIKKRFGLEKDGYYLSLGRIVPEKGLHYLIQAFRACKTGKKLVIAGGGEADSQYYSELKKMAEGDERILFTGYVKGRVIGELYSNAYVFLLPSNLEGMANALLEAMSYGNCCLVSDIPENVEVTGDSALTFKKGDIEDLKQKIQYLEDEQKEAAQYRGGAQQHVLDRYNWDLIVEQMLEIYQGNLIHYEEVLERHRRREGQWSKYERLE